MIDNFTLINDENFNCRDIILASLLKWKNLDYELIFTYAWGLGFNKWGTKLSRSLITGSNNTLQAINEFYNHPVKNKIIARKDAIDYIEKQLNGGFPVIVDYDFFWCPWNSRYKRKKQSHVILITGMNKQSKCFYSWDRSSFLISNSSAALPYADFLRGYSALGVFKNPEAPGNANWGRLLLKILANLSLPCRYRYKINTGKINFKVVKQGMHDYLENLCQLAIKMEKTRTLQNERLTEKIDGDNPLFRRFGEMSSGRRKFSYFLKYASKKTGWNELADLGDEMNMIGWQWEKNKQFVMKAYNPGSPRLLFKKWGEYIAWLAHLEKAFVWKLSRLAFSREFRTAPELK